MHIIIFNHILHVICGKEYLKKVGELMKNEDKSMAYMLVSLLKRVIICFIVLIVVIVGGFLYYIRVSNNKATNVDAVGVYNLVDSEGNVIATDLTAEDIEMIRDLVNGKN